MKKKVAFVCTHNSCRSIMAEAWARHLGKDVLDAYSAGTEKYDKPKPLAIEVEDNHFVACHKLSGFSKDEIARGLDKRISDGQ